MNRKSIALAIVALSIAACSSSVGAAPAEPTPQVIEKRVEVQVPGPTVYVMPDSCVTYIVALEELEQLRIDAYNLLLDGGTPDVEIINSLNEEAMDIGAACVNELPSATAPAIS